MMGSTAQMVALACHLNAASRGIARPPLFPGNSACQFCEHVRFVRPEGGVYTNDTKWEEAAASPDEWLAQYDGRGSRALLFHWTENDPARPDRRSAGFVGGGGRWTIAVHPRDADVVDLWEGR